MKQVIRLLSYEYEDDERLEQQLGRSMPDGIRDMGHGNQLRVITLPERFVRLIGQMALEASERELPTIDVTPTGDYATNTVNGGPRV